MNMSLRLLAFGKLLLRGIYAPMKLRKTKKKITIISRQSDVPSLDIALLTAYLKDKHPDIRLSVLCRRIGEGANRAVYPFHMLRQMWDMADSRVVVLDGYCIAASVLEHPKDTVIIQMWHALAAVKKFGYQTLDREGGHSSAIADVMCMHRNYHRILAPSKATGRYFCEAFDADESRLVFLGLPRIDTITGSEVYGLRRGLGISDDKEIILYAPTFRKTGHVCAADVVKAIDSEKQHVVICPHPLDKVTGSDIPDSCRGSFTVDRSNSTYKWMAESDRVITDYSAVAVEAALIDKPLYFFVYDIEDYEKKEGLNIDPRVEMRSVTACTSEELSDRLETSYPMDELKKFRNRYVEVDMHNCTGVLGDYIAGMLN